MRARNTDNGGRDYTSSRAQPPGAKRNESSVKAISTPKDKISIRDLAIQI